MKEAIFFVFRDLPGVFLNDLSSRMTDAGVEADLKLPDFSSKPGSTHGELVSGTAIVIATKVVVPIVVAWLVKRGPPKPRKETLEIRFPDGRVVTHTIEYCSTSDVGKLGKQLLELIGLDKDFED